MFCEFSNPFISTAQFHWPNHPLTLNGSRDHGYSSAHALPDNPQFRAEASPGNPLLLGDLRHNLRDSSSLLFPSQHRLATVALGWASREILVATIVVCSPTIKPLGSQAKRSLSDKYSSGTWKSRGGSNPGISRLTDHCGHRDANGLMTIRDSSGQKRAQTYKMTVMGRSHPNTESQDHINAIGETERSSTSSINQGVGNGIVVKTEFAVTTQ